MIIITFYDFGPDKGYFHFDYSNNKGANSRISVEKPGVVPKWRTTRIVVEDADFTNVIDGKYNIRLVSNLYNAFAKIEIVNISVAERSDEYIDLGTANSVQVCFNNGASAWDSKNGSHYLYAIYKCRIQICSL